MHWRNLVGGMLLVGALAAQAEVEVRGKHFTLVGVGVDERTATQALEVVEPVWPLVCEVFGARRARPEKPLRVHLYRAVDDYIAADRKLTGGRFGPNQAMSHWDSKSAHVAMQPPCPDTWLRRHGLPLQTEAMLAWEACHLVRYELCPNFRQHPKWFQDGLAATTSERALRARHARLGATPFFEQRWLRVQRLQQRGALPKVQQVLAGDLPGIDMRDRYAVHIAFYRYADQHAQKALRRVAAKVRSTGGGSSYAAAVRAFAERKLGGLEQGFGRYVSDRRLTWDEVFRSLWIVGDEWPQVAFADKNALAFRTEPVSGGGFIARGAVHIATTRNGQMNLLFARSERGFYSLAITAGYGVTLFEHVYEGNVWRVLGREEHRTLAAGTDVPFTVRGQGRQVTVQIDGREFAFELPRELPDEIVWGVSTQAGAAGIWKGVQVGPVDD